jgi:hypothetical protein
VSRDMPEFHPKLGLLCLSPRRRPSLRLATVAVLAALATGATMGLAVAHRTDGERLTVSSQPMDEQPPARPLDNAANSPQPAHAQACQAGTSGDMAALFFNPSCGARKPHARHGGRPTNRVATVILGRVDAK